MLPVHACRGVEARVPFLDRHFLDVAMAIDPAEKMIDKSKGEAGTKNHAAHVMMHVPAGLVSDQGRCLHPHP